MSETRGTLSLTVLAVHGRGLGRGDSQLFADGVIGMSAAVQQLLRAEHPAVQLVPRPVSIDHLNNALDPAPAVALLDITTLDEMFASLVGRLVGLEIPCVFLCRQGEDDAVARLGLDPSQVFHYGNADDLARSELLQREVHGVISTSRILSEMVFALWFPRSTNTIWVVCPQIHHPGEFADRSSADYTYMDNLGDTDALLDLMVFLSRHYPTATIGHFCARDLPPGHTSGNLVVIGGPGEGAEIGNDTCRVMMSEIRSRVSYSEDCSQMVVEREGEQQEQFEAELDPSVEATGGQVRFGLRQDRGYFARFPNPLNENTAVVLVNGIHTRGVLGAGKAFADRREALRNYHSVFTCGVDPRRFECHFAVRVVNGDVQVPEVAARDIHPLGQATVAVSPHGAARHPTADRESLTVVFVAGDRGGSHVNQVQIPREINGIQAALRGCKLRDSITFANPILAASVRAVGDANRDVPGVMHFAGHGDNRSLSLILDENILVGPQPVEAPQLAGILQAFSKRLRLCVLNTCNSATIAEFLCTDGAVDSAVGWSGKVPDSIAIAFSESLYSSLGDGVGVAKAVELAAASTSADPHVRPVYYVRHGVDGGAPIVQGGHLL